MIKESAASTEINGIAARNHVQKAASTASIQQPVQYRTLAGQAVEEGAEKEEQNA